MTSVPDRRPSRRPTPPAGAARLVGYLALAAVDAALASSPSPRARRARWLTKPALMPLLMPGRDRRTQVALGLGGVGDVALLGTGQAAFGAGLGAFLASHLVWLDVLRRRASSDSVSISESVSVSDSVSIGESVSINPARAAAGVAYLGAAAGLTRYLWPRTGALRWPVIGYSGALLAMALAALRAPSRRGAVGGGLFLVSDSLLAVRRFGDVRLPGHDALVMTTYTAAQALLAGE